MSQIVKCDCTACKSPIISAKEAYKVTIQNPDPGYGPAPRSRYLDFCATCAKQFILVADEATEPKKAKATK